MGVAFSGVVTNLGGAPAGHRPRSWPRARCPGLPAESRSATGGKSVVVSRHANFPTLEGPTC
eukprot:scaffold64826_cov66-Phaeocystis_antarctica.AAC.3